MRAYGLPRHMDVQYPDIRDIQMYGLASHVGKFPGKSGDYHPYLRSNHRAWVRRIWKKRERARQARELQKEME